jgi:hypothetical protein
VQRAVYANLQKICRTMVLTRTMRTADLGMLVVYVFAVAVVCEPCRERQEKAIFPRHHADLRSTSNTMSSS